LISDVKGRLCSNQPGIARYALEHLDCATDCAAHMLGASGHGDLERLAPGYQGRAVAWSKPRELAVMHDVA
jgi:hypothetical protein